MFKAYLCCMIGELIFSFATLAGGVMSLCNILASNGVNVYNFGWTLALWMLIGGIVGFILTFIIAVTTLMRKF